jgi:dihydroorotase
VRQGVVHAVGPDLAAHPGAREATVVDAAGLVVAPGLVDLHVHLREPGQPAKETIAAGTAAAARGGFTTVVCMPNTSPAIDSAAQVALVQDKVRREARIRVEIAGAITVGRQGEELAPIGSLAKAGVVAITDDGDCVQNNELMRRALEYAQMFGLVVMDHCQDFDLTEDAVMHEGRWSLRLGLRGWPAVGEDIIVARNIILAEFTRTPVHCQHVSTANAVQLLKRAQDRGVPITGEACPHHFTLTDAALAGAGAFWAEDGRATAAAGLLAAGERPDWPSYDTNFKMNPPLRSAADRAAIIEGLKSGILTVLCSDHAPHCNYEKDVEFDEAPFGITGLETEFALSLTELYHAGHLPLLEVLRRFTANPARLLKLKDHAGRPLGELAPGAPADLVLLDPEARWTYRRDESLSRSWNSPFDGWPLRGRALATLLGGRVVHSGLPALPAEGAA